MTVKEIAKLAGTSRGTVDRVLNGRGNVNPELAQKIKDIAAKENYQPNQLARALINSRKHTRIGVVIHSVGNPFFDDVLKGIYSRAKKLGSYGLEVSVKQIRGYCAKEQMDAIDELLMEGIDGLAIMPINVPEIKARLETLTIPIVTFNTDIDIHKIAFVGCDYYNSGKISGDLAKLILNRGGNAAIVIGSSKIFGHRQRVEGFVDSVSKTPGIKVIAELENEDDDEQSFAVVKRLLEEQEPDLIYFAAAGIDGGIRAILESGSDVRILTVDDTEPVHKYLKDGVISATVTQQPYVQGDNAIKILYDFIANNKSPREVNNFTENQVKLSNSK
jgi:LacI family transcriptional regulator